MSYRLQPDAQLAEDLRRIAREQLRQAIADLAGDDLDAGVHQARKRCKKLRGLLRLAHDPLGSDYSRLNARLRDTARSLSRLRDASALIEALDALVEAQGDDEDFQDAAGELRQHFEQEREQIAEDEDLGALARTAGCQLQLMLKEVERWPLDEDLVIEDLMPGLERTYRRGHAALADAPAGDADAVHEWRKRAKYLWYHVRLLRMGWKRPLKALEQELDELGELLGDHHDLAVMQQAVADLRSDGALDDDSLDLLESRIASRLEQLLAQALPLGQRIWAEKPGRFVARMRSYWALEQGQAEAVS